MWCFESSSLSRLRSRLAPCLRSRFTLILAGNMKYQGIIIRLIWVSATDDRSGTHFPLFITTGRGASLPHDLGSRPETLSDQVQFGNSGPNLRRLLWSTLSEICAPGWRLLFEHHLVDDVHAVVLRVEAGCFLFGKKGSPGIILLQAISFASLNAFQKFFLPAFDLLLYLRQ